jgi:hypothetical protein
MRHYDQSVVRSQAAGCAQHTAVGHEELNDHAQEDQVAGTGSQAGLALDESSLMIDKDSGQAKTQ